MRSSTVASSAIRRAALAFSAAGIGLRGRMVPNADFHHRAEAAKQRCVDDRYGHLPGFDGRLQRGAQILVVGHFHVATVQDRVDRAVDRAEVGGHEAAKAPVLAEDLVHQHVVLAAVYAEITVVGSHERRHLAFLHRCFEGRQIDFAQGPLVNAGVDLVAVLLLVVQCVVLDVGDDALALDALNVGHGQPADEEGVFAVGLERAAVLRHAGDVHVRGLEERVAEVGGLAGRDDAILAGRVEVPRRRQGDRRGQGRGGALVPRPGGTEAGRPVGHQENRECPAAARRQRCGKRPASWCRASARPFRPASSGRRSSAPGVGIFRRVGGMEGGNRRGERAKQRADCTTSRATNAAKWWKSHGRQRLKI